MSPIAPRSEVRRMLAFLATVSALFLSGASIAGCQNDTAAQSVPQVSADARNNSSDQASVSDPTTTPTSTTLAATPLVVSTPPSPAGTAPAPIIAAAPPPPASTTHVSGSCDADHYRSSDGNCVHRPQQAATAPSGATAQCKDGSYSFSQHRQGTCSGHHGVAQWL
jgi:hypothetical protein